MFIQCFTLMLISKVHIYRNYFLFEEMYSLNTWYLFSNYLEPLGHSVWFVRTWMLFSTEPRLSTFHVPGTMVGISKWVKQSSSSRVIRYALWTDWNSSLRGHAFQLRKKLELKKFLINLQPFLLSRLFSVAVFGNW